MPFTGTAVITQTTDRKVRITGLSLAGGGLVTGTVGLFGDTGADVQLPRSFGAEPSHYDGQPLALADVLEARTPIIALPAVGVGVAIAVGKGGSPFRITYQNLGAATDPLELWIERSN